MSRLLRDGCALNIIERKIKSGGTKDAMTARVVANLDGVEVGAGDSLDLRKMLSKSLAQKNDGVGIQTTGAKKTRPKTAPCIREMYTASLLGSPKKQESSEFSRNSYAADGSGKEDERLDWDHRGSNFSCTYDNLDEIDAQVVEIEDEEEEEEVVCNFSEEITNGDEEELRERSSSTRSSSFRRMSSGEVSLAATVVGGRGRSSAVVGNSSSEDLRRLSSINSLENYLVEGDIRSFAPQCADSNPPRVNFMRSFSVNHIVTPISPRSPLPSELLTTSMPSPGSKASPSFSPTAPSLEKRQFFPHVRNRLSQSSMSSSSPVATPPAHSPQSPMTNKYRILRRPSVDSPDSWEGEKREQEEDVCRLARI